MPVELVRLMITAGIFFLILSSVEFWFSSMRMKVLGFHLRLLSQDVRRLKPGDSLCEGVAKSIDKSGEELMDKFMQETWMGRRMLKRRKKMFAQSLQEEADRIIRGGTGGH